MPTSSRTVGLVRGEALNSFETEVWARLADFRTVAVGRRGRTPVAGLPVEARYLRSPSTLPGSRTVQAQLRRRWPEVDVDKLIGVEAALADADVVHAAETFIAWSEQAARVAERLGKPLVLTCWETIPFLHEERADIRRRKDYLRGVASHFVVPTERARDALLEERTPAERITVLPPGIDAARYEAAAAEQRTARVLVPARIIAEKGGVEAVRAWAALPRTLTAEAELVFVGQGPAAGRVLAAAEQTGVADSVRVIGSVPHADMPRLFGESMLTLLPSLTTPYWEEQFGMVLAESMAAGTPILATASGAIPEVVGDAGRLVPPYDVPAMTEALHELLVDADLRSELARRGRGRVKSFDADTVAPQLNELYLRLLS